MSLKSWFRGLKGKLLLVGAIPVVMLIGAGGFSMYTSLNLGRSIDSLNTNVVPLNEMSGRMETQVNAIFRWLWTADELKDSPAEKDAAIAKLRESMSGFELNRNLYGALLKDEESKQLYKKVEDGWMQAVPQITAALDLLEAGKANQTAELRQLAITQIRPTMASVLEGIIAINENIKKLTTARSEADATLIRRSTYINLFGLVVSILLTFGFTVYFARSLSAVLCSITERVSGAAVEVTGASGQLSGASQQLSEGASRAATSIQETSASLEELASMVTLNADHAKQASELSATSRSSAEKGEVEIQQLIGAMGDIGQSSKKIVEIIDVIDDIAFQTNLLALNAAVEAARAGEQGRGFAVVADAVRTLAQRSASAAKDINTLIKESVQKVENGSKIATSSGTVLREIVTSVKKVADLNSEIAQASSEQSSGIGQINKAMTGLDQTTQGNAASAEEVASSSNKMSQQAQLLQGSIQELNVVIYGSLEEVSRASVEPETAFKVIESSPEKKPELKSAA